LVCRTTPKSTGSTPFDELRERENRLRERENRLGAPFDELRERENRLRAPFDKLRERKNRLRERAGHQRRY
jgi:predicted nuclease with TOPRIM domain